MRQSRWGRWGLACWIALAGAIFSGTQLALVQPPALAADRPALCSAAGLAGGAAHCAASTDAAASPKPPWRWPLLRCPSGADSTAAPAAGAEQLQQHRQQPCPLSRPGGCAGPRLVAVDGGCALAHHSDDALGDQHQLRQCGGAGALLPPWLWELNETWAVQPVAALARDNPGGELEIKGYDERPSLNWYAGQRIERFKGARSPSQRQAPGGLQHRRPGGAMDTGQLPVA